MPCQFRGTWYQVWPTSLPSVPFAPPPLDALNSSNPRECPFREREFDILVAGRNRFLRMLHRTIKGFLSVLLAQNEVVAGGQQSHPRRPPRDGCVNSCKEQRSRSEKRPTTRLVDRNPFGGHLDARNLCSDSSSAIHCLERQFDLVRNTRPKHIAVTAYLRPPVWIAVRPASLAGLCSS